VAQLLQLGREGQHVAGGSRSRVASHFDRLDGGRLELATLDAAVANRYVTRAPPTTSELLGVMPAVRILGSTSTCVHSFFNFCSCFLHVKRFDFFLVE
jgi:hypothetical protein